MKRDAIITLPHVHLRAKSKRIGFITDEIRQLADDMQSALLDWEDNRSHEIGVALAAVQINQLLRLVVVRNSFKDKSDREFNVLINPEITKFEGKIVEDFEGCLSVKDIYGKVPRHHKVRVRAMDLTGHEVRLTAEGFLARVIQHEIDHTKGIVFIDHIRDNPEAFYILKPSGELEKLDYDLEVKENTGLWG